MIITYLAIGFIVSGFCIAVKSSKAVEQKDLFDELKIETTERENEIYHM